MRRYIIPAVLTLAFGLLAGCGQKGPLYLPTKAAAAASAASAPAIAASVTNPAEPATVAMPVSSSSGGG